MSVRLEMKNVLNVDKRQNYSAVIDCVMDNQLHVERSHVFEIRWIKHYK